MSATRRRVATGILVLAAVGLAPVAADAASLVFVRDANVWVSRPDGGGARALTTDGSATAPYQAPSEDDHGVVVAQRGALFVRLDQQGRRLGTVRSVVADAPAGSAPAGPFAPRVSPDGSLIAYHVGLVSGAYDPACDCTATTDEEDVVVTRSDGSGPAGTVRFWRSPSWADAHHVVLAAPGNRQTAQIGFADTTALADGGHGWFADDGHGTGGLLVDLDQPDLARGLDRLAAVRGMAAERLALYAVGADGQVAPRCDLTAPDGWYERPAWSPDGRTLTYTDRRGVWAVDVPAELPEDCGALHPALVAPGAQDAGWSAADLADAPATAATGRTPAPGGPPTAAPPGPAGPPAVRDLAIRAGRRGVVLTVDASPAARLDAVLARCGAARPACRRVAVAHRRAATRHRVRLGRALRPGRYRLTAALRGPGGTATVARTVRVR